MRIMILPGHSHWDNGAVNTKIGKTEYQIVLAVSQKLFAMEDFDKHDIIFKNRNKSYGMLPAEINSWGPDLIMELHLNAASDSKVQGTEVLIAKGSSKGKFYGQIVLNSLLDEFGFKNRGIKEISKEDRGATLLYKTKAPCMIVEAYFLSGITDEQNNDEFLINKYADAVYKALKKI